MTDLDSLPFANPDSQPNLGAAPRRKCRRHEYDFRDTRCAVTGLPPASCEEHTSCPPIDRCRRCDAVRDETRARRGRTSLRAGKDAERAIAKAYPGGKRTGHFGGPDDVVVGELFTVQSKAGPSWFRESYWTELAKLPRTGGRIPTLIVSDRPGPGHRTRRMVIRSLEDDVALHGEKP